MEQAHPRFALGTIVGTPAALAVLQSAGFEPLSLLTRHRQGDFGQLDAGDVQQQNRALEHEHAAKHRERMMSVYHLSDKTVIWIITEADRSSTCILLPHEY